MQTSFNNKVAFKQAFLNGLNEIYQTTLEASTVEQRYTILAKMLDESLEEGLNRTNEVVKTQGLKKTIYFSMEFLMGRLITNNLYNTGNYHIVKEVFDDWNLDLNEVENAESDAGLGNGGLGRLAACFLDSAASVGLPLYGNSLRYQHGFFMQDIQNHKQVEFPDPWLNKPFVWEKRMDRVPAKWNSWPGFECCANLVER